MLASVRPQPTPALPSLTRVCASRRHRRTDELVDTGLSWLGNFVEEDRLVAMARALAGSRFHELTGRTMPALEFDDLRLAHDWALWLFFQDDLCDDSRIGRDPKALSAAHRPLHRALQGRAARPNEAWLADALRDILDRLARRSSTAAYEAFIATVRAYLAANLREATHRHHSRVPTPDDYVAMREDSGAVDTMFAMLDAFRSAEDASASEEIVSRHTPLRAMANRHICWVNDILGYERERVEDNSNNLVHVLAVHRALAPRDALAMAISMSNVERSRFESSSAALADGPDAMRRTELRDWMQGSLDWHRLSQRYEGGVQLTEFVH